MTNQIILENRISEHFTVALTVPAQQLQFDDITPLVTMLTAFSEVTEVDIEDVVTGWETPETHGRIAQAIAILQSQHDAFMTIAAPAAMAPDTQIFLDLMVQEITEAIAEAQAVIG